MQGLDLYSDFTELRLVGEGRGADHVGGDVVAELGPLGAQLLALGAVRQAQAHYQALAEVKRQLACLRAGNIV